jgi:hypothetical protein
MVVAVASPRNQRYWLLRSSGTRERGRQIEKG